MGLGKMLQTRSVLNPGSGTRYEVYNDATNALLQTFTVDANVAPDWPTSFFNGAMSVPGAWRASLLIAELLAGAPWQSFRKASGDDPAPRLVEPTPPLLEQPQPPETRFTTIRSAALDYLWHGNAIGIWAARDRAGWPTAVVMVPAESVFVRRVDERHYPLPVGTIEYMIGDLSFSADEVLHIKGPCRPGDLRGLGVLEAHLGTLSLARDLQDAAGNLTGYGVPTGVLKSENPDLKPHEARKMKASWLESQRTRTIAVLNATTSFEPVGWNPQEAQLVEARKFSLSEQELIFGLPVGWLGGQTSSRTYSNIEQDAINLLKFTLGGHFAQFKQTLSQAFPRGMFVEPDLDALLASDTVTRYGAYNVATAGKAWLLPSEVRARERLRAVEGIDETAPSVPAATEPGTPGAPSVPAEGAGGTEIEEIAS